MSLVANDPIHRPLLEAAPTQGVHGAEAAHGSSGVPRVPGASDASAKSLHAIALACLLALIALSVAWELFLAPLRPGGSWLVLKVVPLLFVLRGVLRADNYTLQWSTLLVWAYFTEGVVRAASDAGLAAQLALVEVLLSTIYFGCAAFYLRPLKKLSKLSKQGGES